MRKQLLVFSYHFPPSNEVGAVRWHRMAQRLSEQGWQVTVVAKQPESPENVVRSASGVERVGVVHRPSLLLKIATIRQSVRSFLRLRSRNTAHLPASSAQPARSGSLTANGTRPPAVDTPDILRTLLLMSQEGRWATDAVSRAENSQAATVLLSAGPPHAIHFAVSRLARRRRVPHVIDMRDPWSLVERLSPWVDMRLHRKVSRYMESRAVRHAALVVCNTELAAEAMRQAYPDAANRIICVMNGADPEDIPEESEWVSDRFLCVHTGTVYLDRMPVALLKATRKAIDALHLSPREFALAFRGVVEEAMRDRIMQLVHELDLSDYVQILPRIGRREAMEWTASAQLSVVLPQDSTLALPSKVFELAQLRSWMLVFAAAGSATAEALRGTSATIVEPNDDIGASAALIAAVKAFREGKRPTPVDSTRRMLRSRQADVLREQLDALVTSSHPL